MANLRDTRTSDKFVAVTPSDDPEDNIEPFRALSIGTGGDVAVVGIDGVAVTFKNRASGTELPVQGVRVNVTNTSASDLVALY